MISENEIWALIGRKVKIELDTGEKKRNDVAIGYLVTRDCVSHAVLIADIGEKIEKVEWIPRCSVKRISRVEGCDDDKNELIEKFFEQGNSSEEELPEVVKQRAQKVVLYLKSHHLEVTEQKDGAYLIAGTVRFEAPYRIDNFYCDIPIVLKRILKLVEEIE